MVLINPSLNRDYGKDRNLKALIRRGFVSHTPKPETQNSIFHFLLLFLYNFNFPPILLHYPHKALKGQGLLIMVVSHVFSIIP